MSLRKQLRLGYENFVIINGRTFQSNVYIAFRCLSTNTLLGMKKCILGLIGALFIHGYTSGQPLHNGMSIIQIGKDSVLLIPDTFYQRFIKYIKDDSSDSRVSFGSFALLGFSPVDYVRIGNTLLDSSRIVKKTEYSRDKDLSTIKTISLNSTVRLNVDSTPVSPGSYRGMYLRRFMEPICGTIIVYYVIINNQGFYFTSQDESARRMYCYMLENVFGREVARQFNSHP